MEVRVTSEATIRLEATMTEEQAATLKAVYYNTGYQATEPERALAESTLNKILAALPD